MNSIDEIFLSGASLSDACERTFSEGGGASKERAAAAALVVREIRGRPRRGVCVQVCYRLDIPKDGTSKCAKDGTFQENGTASHVSNLETYDFVIPL